MISILLWGLILSIDFFDSKCHGLHFIIFDRHEFSFKMNHEIITKPMPLMTDCSWVYSGIVVNGKHSIKTFCWVQEKDTS